MPRYALLLEYDGTGFVGWQVQDNGLSLQGVLEGAAARLAGGAQVASVVAGRTDAGVHAEGQVAQLDLATGLAPDRLRDALNFHMKPHRMVVLRAAMAPAGWNARFSAIGRSYRYRILNRRARPGLLEGQVWHVDHPLDAAAMAAAAAGLLGRHDFSSFRASACQANSPLRTLDRLEVTRHGDMVEIVAEARSFLHHQVRNMVGTLKLVGAGSWPVERVAACLAARNRSAAGPTAPAAGLTLIGVRYAEDPFSPLNPLGFSPLNPLGFSPLTPEGFSPLNPLGFNPPPR
jgi:tRNA pseudouridine38-40 synthase